MSSMTEIYIIAVLVALACALPGVFLVLRGQSMMSDAITHSIILGIVVAYFCARDLNSPLLLIAATAVGVLVTFLVELLNQTGLLKKDAAIGSVFPLFFSLGMILLTRYASDTHLDADSVLVGELAFAPFNRFMINGVDLGPKSMWTMGIILIINSLFIFLFYKELKLSTFDPAFAASIGFAPVALHYALMTLVSLTTVGAYDSVGAILVVGFMVGPALSAYLLTKSLGKMIAIALIYAVVNSVLGVYVAYQLDLSFAGMIATVTGLTTIVTYIFSPYTRILPQRTKSLSQ